LVGAILATPCMHSCLLKNKTTSQRFVDNLEAAIGARNQHPPEATLSARRKSAKAKKN